MKNILIWSFVLPVYLAAAQVTTRWIPTIIQKAEYKDGGEWKLILGKPGDIVLQDSSGFLVGSKAVSSFRNQNLSNVFLTTITNEHIEAQTSTFDEITSGDIVFLKVKVAVKSVYAGKLFELGWRGVFFKSPGGKSYYTWNEIAIGNKAWEDKVVVKMLEDTKKAAQSNTNEIEAGPNKGRKVSDLTATSSAVSIQNFIVYTTRMSQVYSTSDFDFTTHYFKWMQSGSPEITTIDQILKGGREGALKFKSILTDKTTGELLINLANGANIQYSFSGSIEPYTNALKEISNSATQVLSGSDLGFIYFNYGAALHTAENYTESFERYQLAAQVYESTDVVQYARAISRQAECAEQLKDLKSAGILYGQSADQWRKIIKQSATIYNFSRLRIVLEGLARCQDELNSNQEYINTQLELASVYSKLKLLKLRGNSFWNIGYTYGTKLKDANNSNPYYEKAYQVFDSIKSVRNAVVVLCNQAINHRSIEDYKKALELGQRAEAYAKANLNDDAQAYALENILSTYKAEEKNEKALEVAFRIDKIYASLNDNEKLATAKDEIASLLSALGKNEEAVKVAEEAVKVYESITTGQGLANAYWNAGYYIGSGKLELSNEYYQKAYEYFKDVSTKSATTLLSNQAVNYRDNDQRDNSYNKHAQAFQFALDKRDTSSLIYAIEKYYFTCSHFKDYGDLAEAGVTVARLYRQTGDEEKVKEWLEKTDEKVSPYLYDASVSIDIKYKINLQRSKIYELKDDAVRTNDYLLAAATLNPDNRIAIQELNKVLVQYLKNYELEQSLNLNPTKKDDKVLIQLSYTHSDLVETYLQFFNRYNILKNRDSAQVYFDKALAIATESKKNPLLVECYQSKGKMERGQDASEAIRWYEKAESLGEIDDQMTVKDALAELYIETKQFDKAITKRRERLQIGSKSKDYTITDLQWNLAYALSLKPGNIKESNDYYLKAAAVYKKDGQMTNYITAMSNIGFNYRDVEDSVNAYKVMRELVKAVKPTKPDEYETSNYCLALEKAGHVFKYFEHHQQAARHRKLAAEGYELLGKSEQACNLFDDAGKSAEAAGVYEFANDLYTRSYNAAVKLDDNKKIAGALWSMAFNVGSNLERNKEAIPLYEDAYTNYMEAGDTANASVMRSNIGQNYWRLLDFDKAIENHTQAIDIATKGKYFTQVASSWQKLADLYKETKNPTKQAMAMDNAISTLEVLKDSSQLLTSYYDIAASYTELQEVAKAHDYYNRALVLASAKKDSINIAWSNYKFAGLYHGRKPDLAKQYYVKTIDLQRKLKDKTNLIYTLASQGSLIMESDRVQSENMLKEALDLANELKDEYVIGYCHARLYDLYRSFGKPEVAHKHIDISTDLFKKLNERNSLASNYMLLANEYLYDYGDFVKSQKYMADAKVLLDSINNPLSNASFYGENCNIYEDQGQFDLALAELDKAQEIYKSLKNDWGLAGVFIDYGNIYRSLGEYKLALKYQTMSDSLYQTLNLQYQRLAPIANIGDVYFDQGDYPKALEYFKRSLKYMEDNKDQNTNICKLYSGVGLVYSYMTNYDEAEKWMMIGLETSKRINATRTGADILSYLGKLKIETKKYDEAEKYLLEAKNFLITQNLMVERTPNATHLGHLYLKKGELEKAKEELTEAIALAEKFGKEIILWEAYFRMGDYYRKSGNLKEAKNYLLKSVGVIDKLKNNIVGGEEAKKLFSSDKWILEAYEELISVLLESGETEEAMAWLQKINENNVKDKIRSLDVTFENEEKNKALALEKDLKMKLEAMEKQIAAQKQSKSVNTEQIKKLESIKNIAEGDYLKFVNQTVNVQPELSRYFSNTVQPSQLKGKKKQIPKDMALVSYLVGEKQLYIFVATSDTVVARIVSIPKEKIHRDVNAMANIIKSHLGNFGTIDLSASEAERKETVFDATQTDQMLKPFEEAYHYLISPVSELISGKGRLGIIPTGELNYIPFQLLGKTLKTGKFSLLINQFSLFYTNSTDMLLRSVTGDKELKILAFGNPDKTLPATEREVKDIKKIFPNTMVYVQDEATEDKAKYAPEEFNVMHFATHGNLDYEDFSKSYLTMSSNVAKNEDGMLTLEELWGMEVMSHLNIVVLSACQTAVTKGSDESSPVSPASGFLQNGVKSVVATLWKVDDEATSILMNEFYKNIKTMDAVDAMRVAQATLASLPKFNHPYYWAAMVLIGDWR